LRAGPSEFTDATAPEPELALTVLEEPITV
jgi:hypothetical protein